MKGLLLKDLCNFRKYGKQLTVILALYVFLGMFIDSFQFMEVCIIVMGGMMVLTSISYDELAKWDEYALTMPISRRVIVKSKYTLLLLTTVTGCIISLCYGLLIQTMKGGTALRDFGLLVGIVGELTLIGFSIILPLVFRYGVEKARIWLLCILMTPTILAVIITKYILPSVTIEMETIIRIGKIVGMLTPAITILILYFSYFVSTQIFEKKAF